MENAQELMEHLDGIKQKITDNEYLELVRITQKIYSHEKAETDKVKTLLNSAYALFFYKVPFYHKGQIRYIEEEEQIPLRDLDRVDGALWTEKMLEDYATTPLLHELIDEQYAWEFLNMLINPRIVEIDGLHIRVPAFFLRAHIRLGLSPQRVSNYDIFVRRQNADAENEVDMDN
jgi:hypothetical protein